LAACASIPPYDPTDPARGPGDLVGNDGPVSDGNFLGGDDVLPAARAVTPPGDGEVPTCDSDCANFCLGAGLANPVNAGLCSSLWGVGLEPRPIEPVEACRRLYVDMIGRFPSEAEVQANCIGRPWGDVVKSLLNTEEFVALTRRHYADVFLYNTQAVSLERVYDMDRLVDKFARGFVSYDVFAQVVSAHPVVVRRYAQPEDVAEAVFTLLMGRPPFDFERRDFSHFYTIWTPGYYNHLALRMRMPDAAIYYPCSDEYGYADPDTIASCTSTLWGNYEVVLEPDWRAGRVDYGNFGPEDRVMWSGMLKAEEWKYLWAPGRALATQPEFWDKAVDDVLEQYLEYDLGNAVPDVRARLIEYLADYNGDIRALHFAIATSVAYLQSSAEDSPTDHRWTFGPRKQAAAEVWLDSMNVFSGRTMNKCDHRLSRPNDLLDSGSVSSYRILQLSEWEMTNEGEVDMDYANIARTLGGCPENEVGGRFRVVSILTTATQLNFVNELCAAVVRGEREPTPTEVLLPAGVDPGTTVDSALAGSVFDHLTRAFLGRPAHGEELTAVDDSLAACQQAGCSAEHFARASCFAVLSSAEMLFY
jgi:hypothetical protein